MPQSPFLPSIDSKDDKVIYKKAVIARTPDLIRATKPFYLQLTAERQSHCSP